MHSQEQFQFNHWYQHYLQLETERFELTLKYFFDIGVIDHEDYQFLAANLKMIKKYLKSSLSIRQKHEQEQQHYLDDSYNYKQLHLHRKSRNRKYSSDSYQASLFDVIKPIPITGEIIVSGLKEGLQALKQTGLEKTGPKFPHKIPAGTYWNQVIIKFLDDEQVEIYVKKQKHTTDYKEMGFVGKGKVPEPSEQWIFLRVLAQYNGEIAIKDDTARDTYKQQKYLLTESLKDYFSIDYDPFYPYKSSPEKHGNSYRIKLTLLPPPKPKQSFVTEAIDEDTLGIKEFLDEHAPQIFDS
jgi:hypothetical protein